MIGTDHHFKPLKFLHLKYWLTWTGIGLLWLTSKLPYSLILKLGVILGLTTFYLMPGRRRITRTNIRLCFPELSETEHARITKQNFIDSAIALFESPLAWWGNDNKLKNLYTIEGLEHIEEANKQGKGIILLGAHYTTLEIGGRFLAFEIEWRPTFKRAHNKLFNAIMARARRRVHGGLLHSSDMRSIIRYLQDT
ncbi:MAG: lipid A biosynthesis lauroyl acyltransferase, partial [Gammaproteobacteria bacterium]|nr:lipid A biosynthesis lauroyl acyltransferase [Gammaproteobacteria bacterium]